MEVLPGQVTDRDPVGVIRSAEAEGRLVVDDQVVESESSVLYGRHHGAGGDRFGDRSPQEGSRGRDRLAVPVREDIARAVRNGEECGEVDEHLDPQSAAVRLAAVMEGPALQVYREPEGTAGQAVTRFAVPLLEAEVAVVFTGECRPYMK